MNLYPWIVLVHVTGVTLFFIAHGAPAMVSLRLRSERDPARVLALLDLARWSMGRTAGIALLVGFVAGIVAGFMGGWWGHLWIWLALAIFVGVSLAMTPLTPMTETKLHQMRRAAGRGVSVHRSDSGIRARIHRPILTSCSACWRRGIPCPPRCLASAASSPSWP